MERGSILQKCDNPFRVTRIKAGCVTKNDEKNQMKSTEKSKLKKLFYELQF